VANWNRRVTDPYDRWCGGRELEPPDYPISPSGKTAHIEEVARQWAQFSAPEAAGWIEGQLRSDSSEKAFHQAALSGYLETIARQDPEAAAETARLLDEAVPERSEAVSREVTEIISADPGFPGDADFLTRGRNR